MKILYVEDNPVDADLARRALERLPDCALEVTPTVRDAIERLVDMPAYDIVLADLRLPDGSGLDVLAHIRERGLPLAVVMLTGSGDPDSAVSALKAGADDYLIKYGDYLERLPRTLTAALERFRARSVRESRPLRVLYVEHIAVDIDLTRRHLSQHAPHIRLDVATNAAEALARLPADRADASAYDVVLLDYRLPDLDALEVVKILRNERGLDLPIVLVTGQGSEETAVQALRLGANDYLTKHPSYRFELAGVLENVHHHTELKREQQALRVSEQRCRATFDLAAVGIAHIAPDGRFLQVNGRWCEIVGYRRDELLKMMLQEITHPEDVEPALTQVRQLLAGRSDTYALEKRILHRDGSIIWIHSTVSLVPATSDTPQYLISVIEDITERRRGEERLRLAAAVFESTRDGVMITDLDARILTVNRAFVEITGYSQSDVVGQNARVLQSGRQDRNFYQAMWTSLLETDHWQGEIWNRRKNGETYPEWLTLNTVRNPRGEATSYVGVFTDISQIKQSEARFDHLAHYDPLTDLPNRLLVHSRLEHALEQAARRADRVGVLYIDLDHFKTVNDSLGHRSGDELLVAVARRMRIHLRNEDALARLGGDEFLVVLEYLRQPEDAAGIAEKLILTFEQPFALASGREVYIGGSIGISLYPNDGTTASDLIRNADAAVYQAKAQGRNTYRFYTEALTRKAYERLTLESRLRHALEQGEFVVYYQPLIAVVGGQLIGAEALVRWQPPGESLVPPAEIIPLAEETGLIVPLGDWVLRTACAQARIWRDAGLSPFTLAVNLSPRQFQQQDLVDSVRTALELAGLPPGCLELEITESGLMEHGERSETILRALREMGVRLAIDDFGTGYSSLAYLKRFPIGKLKIDRSFVHDIPENRDDMEIAATIIAVAHKLRMEVLAEGVESKAQLAFLHDQGCDSYQGYLCSPPIPADEFARRFLQIPGI